MKKFIAFLIAVFLIYFPSVSYAVNVPDGSSILSTSGDEYGMNYVIKNDGSLWSWGFNRWGQIGDGTTKDSTKARKILDNVSYVRVGSYHTVALKSNGEVWCWGNNTYGTIGDGTTKNQLKPKKILSNVKYVTSAGNNYTVALKSNGEVWVWGSNSRGQLGNGYYNSELKPKKILENISKVESGSNHVLALKKNGELWAWGYNFTGQVGNSTTKDVLKPIKIISNIRDIIAEHDTSMAISKSGILYIWGSCTVRPSFADDDILSPQKFMADVKSASFDGYDVLIIKKNNELWSFNYRDDYSPYKIMDNIKYACGNKAITQDNILYYLDKNNNLQPTKLMKDVAYVSGDWDEGYIVTLYGNLFKYSYINEELKKEKIMSKVRVNNKN